MSHPLKKECAENAKTKNFSKPKYIYLFFICIDFTAKYKIKWFTHF